MDPSIQVIQIKENQLEQKMEHEIQSGIRV